MLLEAAENLKHHNFLLSSSFELTVEYDDEWSGEEEVLGSAVVRGGRGSKDEQIVMNKKLSKMKNESESERDENVWIFPANRLRETGI